MKLSGYGLGWTAAVLALVALGFWLVLAPGSLDLIPDAEQITRRAGTESGGGEKEDPSGREQRLKRVFGSLWEDPPKVSVEQTRIVISAPDGSITLELETPTITSEQDVFVLKDTSVKVSDVEGAQLELNADRVEMAVGSNEMTIEGSLHGVIPEKSQAFDARRMIWDQQTRKLVMRDVTMKDPAFTAKSNKLVLSIGRERMELSEGITLDF